MLFALRRSGNAFFFAAIGKCFLLCYGRDPCPQKIPLAEIPARRKSCPPRSLPRRNICPPISGILFCRARKMLFVFTADGERLLFCGGVKKISCPQKYPAERASAHPRRHNAPFWHIIFAYRVPFWHITFVFRVPFWHIRLTYRVPNEYASAARPFYFPALPCRNIPRAGTPTNAANAERNADMRETARQRRFHAGIMTVM